MLERVEDGYLQASPGGRYLLYLRDDHYWVFDLATGAHTNITKTVAVEFRRQAVGRDRQTEAGRSAWPGWTTDDAAVWLYDRTDIWSIAPDGSRAQRLTDGARDQVRHRYVRLDRGCRCHRLRGTVVRLVVRAVDEAVWLCPAARRRLVAGRRARDVRGEGDQRPDQGQARDVYAYVRQAFDDSPDLFVGDAEPGRRPSR